jgi:hypothetical protein
MNETTDGRAPGRLRARAVLAAAGVALVLAACGGVDGSAARLDAQFVDTVRSEGHPVSGADREAALVAAARKLCVRRVRHRNQAQRHETALTERELDAVSQAFAGDARRFAALALDTYCPD